MDLYETYFGRAPGAAELSGWKGMITGGAGFEVLQDALMSYAGSLGVQHLTGTAGSDLFEFGSSARDMVIEGFVPGQDIISFDTDLAEVFGHLKAIGDAGFQDVLYAPDTGPALLLKNVTLASLSADDFIFT